ncbi:MAG: hypothetical protein QG653_658 [Patescibacteria group bacterium]|nr:hypothetical protein [Patescibacteria group bacterium]
MLVPILLTSAIIALLSAIMIVLLQVRLLKKGVIVRDEGYNGPAQVSATVNAIVRYMFRRSIHLRKFILQYVFHVFVRVTYYVDVWSSYLYAKSRNLFVKNAVRNRGTVPHFWQHLKVYKQEMDKEKEEKEHEEE